MPTRRTFYFTALALSVAAALPRAAAQQAGMVTLRLRLDDSVRAVIPMLLQRDLAIERDQSEEARELARRAPPERAVPVIFILVGALTVPVVLQLLREALRQTYYGGVIIDTRAQPPSVKSDPQIPGSMVFVIDSEGKTTRYTSDQLSPEWIGSLLKAK